jgi:hypothetical protein
LWRKSRRDGSLAEVRLEPVHADNLGAASNLEAKKFLALLQDSVGALVERAQGRNHPSPSHIHVLGLLQLLEAGGCLCVGQLSRGKRLHRSQLLHHLLHRCLWDR